MNDDRGKTKLGRDWRDCMARPTTILKTILNRREATIFAGAANGLFGRIIEDLGYEAVYVTGAGIGNMCLGAPDIGLTTLTEIANHVSAMAAAVALPFLVDADTGFGNPVNVVRTVKVLERAGAAGLQIEDQVFPMKCGHFEGKDIVPLEEIILKVKAAVAPATFWKQPSVAERPHRSCRLRSIRSNLRWTATI